MVAVTSAMKILPSRLTRTRSPVRTPLSRMSGGGSGRSVRQRELLAEFRDLAGVFLVVVALVVAATLASALAWSGVGLIAFVPLVGLAVFPLQVAALLFRGLAFEYLGLTALGAYLALYQGFASRRAEAIRPSPVTSTVGASARA